MSARNAKSRRGRGAERASTQVTQLIAIAARGLSSIAEQIALPLTLQADKSLREYIRSCANGPQETITVNISAKQAWFSLVGDKISAVRGPSEGIPVIELDEEGVVNSRQYAPSGRRAEKLVTGLARTTHLLTQEEFDGLAEWGPVIERTCYQTATALLGLLPSLREEVENEVRFRPKQRPGGPLALSCHWSVTHTAACLILISAAAGATPWLTDLALHFKWEKWTPTFLLLRERTTWLAAVAAHSVMNFGTAIVAPYLEAFDTALTPVKAFDAVFGLSALAISHPTASDSIKNELMIRRSHLRYEYGGYRHLVLQVLDDGIKAISDAPVAASAGPKASVPDLENRGAVTLRRWLQEDPMTQLPSGNYIGLAMLPGSRYQKRRDLFVSGSNRALKWPSLAEIAATVADRWGLELGPERPPSKFH